jgi:hypothetical protein
LAIGHEVPLDEDGHPTGDGRYVMWASADGLSWREVRVPPQVEFADLKDVIAAENGSFVLLATGSAQFPRELRYVLWSSDGDGDWTRVPHDFGGYGPIRKAVRWAEGYAFLEPLSASPARVFMSDTGLEWEEGLYYHGDTLQTRIYDIGGGDEGIVMLGHRTLQSGEQIEIATATSTGNANDWLERRDPFGDEADFATRLTALGPDWIAVRRGDRLVAEFWRSANGLDWTPVARIDLPDMSLGGDTLFTVGGSVYFAQNAEGAVWPGAGGGSTWSSTDGTTWRQVPMAPGAIVTAGTDLAGGTLLAGVSHDGRATFWTAP